MNVLSHMCRWSMILGLFGLFCGFAGPLYLVPWAEQAPFIGLIAMGLFCMVFGMFVGGAGWMTRQMVH